MPIFDRKGDQAEASAPAGSAPREQSTVPGLRRSLRLWDLILYGVILIQPTAPMSIYGVVSNAAGGHVVSTVLLAMVAMLFTAVSYGRMARQYPSAGSAYTYVARELHPLGGYVVGWSMLMDYLLNPIICVVWCGAASHQLFPAVPAAAWITVFVLSFTALNLRGVQASARINTVLTVFLTVIVAGFFAFAAHYLAGAGRPRGYAWLLPFFDPATFSTESLFHGTSIAVLTYIGFDGISTMSEEVENPRRNIMLGTVLTCLVIGLLSALEVYGAQLIWPARQPFPTSTVDTAFLQIGLRAGGKLLFLLLSAALLVANLGTGIAAQFGAARLLYGMGRDGALPTRFFGNVSAQTGIPRNNVLLLGAVTLAGSFLLSFAEGAELLNFGAFIAFMGVNAAALVRCRFRSVERVRLPAAIPILGFLICGFIWLHLSRSAHALGFAWIGVGLLIRLAMHKGYGARMPKSKPATP